jgi:P27 family predicted phage terminase small subunit
MAPDEHGDDPMPSRKPTHLKLLQGNAGKRPVKRDLTPKPDIPSCPEFLSMAAKQEWDRLANDLHAAGALSQLDRAALAAYCQTWARWMEAEQKLAEEGVVFATPNGHQMPSPWVAVANGRRSICGSWRPNSG